MIKKINLIIILIYTLFHLPFILQPTINHYYSIMQADRSSVARNYYLESDDFLKPRVDVRGNKTGITRMEFPLYNFITALLFKIFHSDWLGFGRIISYLAGLLAVIVANKIFELSLRTRDLLPQTLIAFFICSFYYLISTSILPETLAIFFAYSGFLLSQKKKYFFLIFLSFTLAILIRPYYIFFGLPILINFLQDRQNRLKWLIIIIGSMSILILWYFWYFPYLNEHYQLNYFFMGNCSLENGKYLLSFRCIFDLVYTILKRYVLISFPITFVGFYFLYKLIKSRKFKFQDTIYQLLMISILTIIVIPILVNGHYVNHDYYIAGILPMIALGNILMLKKISKKRYYYPIISLIFIFLIVINFFRYNQSDALKWLNEHKNELTSETTKEDLFVIECSNPSFMYTIDRKGWLFAFSESGEKIYENPCLEECVTSIDSTGYRNINSEKYFLTEQYYYELKKYYLAGAKYAVLDMHLDRTEFISINLEQLFSASDN